MTLVKVMDYYGPDYVDEYHKQVIPDVLSLLDKLQAEEQWATTLLEHGQILMRLGMKPHALYAVN